MSKLKKSISLALALLMLLSVFTIVPLTASAETYTSGDFEYVILEDGTAEITDYSGSETNLTIPSEIDGIIVTSIGYSAFEECKSLTSIDIPNSVTSIGERAFGYCESLASITIPNSVTSIGEDAFYVCESLKSIEIPNSVTSIGDHAFYCCESLTDITIPDSVTSIGYGAFYDTAFYNNEANWENSVLYIGHHLIDANYTYYDENRDEDVQNPISGEYTIKPGTKTIAGSAFEECSSLESIDIPDSATNIGDRAFMRCESLNSINVNSDNSNYCSIDGNLYTKDKAKLIQYAIGKNDTIFTIPDSVTSIAESAFDFCKNLRSVTILEGVTSIGDLAFFGCESLASITIPDSVTSIGINAFSDTAFENNEYNWENGVLYIGKHLIRAESTLSGSYSVKTGTLTIAGSAFYCCDILSVTIPNSVKSIGEECLSFCDNLKDVYYVGNESDWNKIEIGLDNYSLEDATIHFNSEETGSTPITNPSETTSESTEPVQTTPIVTNPITTDPAVTDPITTNSVVTEPSTPSAVVNPTQPSTPTPATPKVTTKKDNPIKVSVKAKTIKAKKLKKKAQKVKTITVKNNQGKVTYKLVKSGITKKIRKLVKIGSNGVITIKKWKKAKKGTYKIKVQIAAAGTSAYNAKTITKTIKVKIK